MGELQTLILRACNNVYLKIEIDWTRYKCVFVVSRGAEKKNCDDLFTADVIFNRMIEENRG